MRSATDRSKPGPWRTSRSTRRQPAYGPRTNGAAAAGNPRSAADRCRRNPERTATAAGMSGAPSPVMTTVARPAEVAARSPEAEPVTASAFSAGMPEFPQCGSDGFGIRHGLLDVVGGDHCFDDPVADQLSHQRFRPASLATCDDPDADAGGERLHDKIDQPWPRRQVGVEDHLVEHHRLRRVDVVGKQLGQHIGLGGDAALAKFGRDSLAFVAQGQQLPVARDGPLEVQAVRGEGGVVGQAVALALDVGEGIEVEDHRAKRTHVGADRCGGSPTRTGRHAKSSAAS